MKKILNLVLLLTLALASHAQRVLTLDSCRALALANNKELRMSQEKVKAAHYEQKAAFTNFLPKIDVGGTYMRTQKEISLLSDAQKRYAATDAWASLMIYKALRTRGVTGYYRKRLQAIKG